MDNEPLVVRHDDVTDVLITALSMELCTMPNSILKRGEEDE